MKAVLLLLTLVGNAAAFKFLSNFKAASLIPRPSAMLKKRKAAKVYGDKKLAVITGTSSGVGLETAAKLLETGEYHVFGAVRNLEKMRSVASDQGFSADDFTPLEVDLNSFDSVRGFGVALDKAKLNRPIDRLICNAATYLPSAEPQWSKDGCPQVLQTNFLSHFLMVSHLLPGMTKASDPRVVFVGGAAAEEGVAVYPRADLGELEGLKAGLTNPVSMVDGFNYDPTKAYKDSKLCLSMLAHMLHDRYHKKTGVAFSSVHPGEVSGSTLFDGKPRDTSMLGQLKEAVGLADAEVVSTEQAAERLFQAAHDFRCSKSGVYWSWLRGKEAEDAAKLAEDEAQSGAQLRPGWEAIYEHEPSERMVDFGRCQDLWKGATKLTNAEWPPAYQPRSPCPTLVVIGAITKAQNAKEDAKRTLEGLEPDEAGASVPIKSIGAKVLGGTGVAIDAIASNTIGRAGKLAQDKLLGGMVEEALEGSFQETASAAEGKAALLKLKREELGLEADGTKDGAIAEALQKRIGELGMDDDAQAGAQASSSQA
eukprot:CAMPEP_0115855714 /NCGR_PEP_ID=MMETSP0287-20121206/14684_1 /TAXON_ID=412157 /ORGANISM="Chrysochromulina rotalis, Strain UIO044" /LENGTH=537 /DNA_ID=CAMNT_0003309875 /DNA_START=3 /DNA_END=1616 /DNA_ORIENTATION=+